MSLRQTISLMLEEASKTQLVTDMRAAGAKSVDALRQEFQRKMGDLKADFSQGLIDERQFREQAKRVADAFNQEIIKRMDALKAAGKDTSREYSELGRQIKIASDTGIRQGGALTAAWGKVKSFAVGMGAAIAAAFTVRAVVDFAKESIAAAVTVGRSWAEIGNAVRSVGGDFVKMRPQIEDTVERIAKSLAFDDEEIRDGLTRFIRATGSVDKGLRGIEVAAKLARSGNISVQQATDLLTRAMETGQARGLQPYVKGLKDSNDILGDVNRQLGDVAATVSPFEKGTRMLSEAWEDLHIAVGNVLISGAEGASVFDVLQGTVKQLTTWVVENKDEIGRWVKGGLEVAVAVLKFLGKTVVDTAMQIGDLIDFIARVDVAMKRAWNGMLVSIASGAQQIMAVVLKLQAGMLKVAEALGLPVAKQIKAAMERTSGYIGDLGTFIATKSVEMRRDLGSDDATATKTDSLGGALAVNTEAGTRKAGGSIAKFADEGKRKFGELATAAKESTKEIAEDLEDYFDKQTAATEKAEDDRLKIITEGASRTNEARDAARVRDLESELVANEAILQSTTATTEQKREAFQRSADIQVELAALAARKTLEEGDREAASREAVEARKRQALIDSGLTAEQVNEEMAKGAITAADSTGDKWLEALQLVNTAFGNLRGVAGGVFDGIVNAAGHVVGGLSAIAGGFKLIKMEGEGLTGILQKIAGASSAIGGVLGIIGLGIDVIGGLFPGDKNPGRLETNAKALEAARRDPNAVFYQGLTALEFLLLKSPTNKGGGGGWATDAAQQDAWTKLQQVLRELSFKNAVPDAFERFVPARRPGEPAYNPSASTAPTTGGTGSTWLPGYQHGGWVRETGPARVHAGELVLPGTLAQQLLSVAGMQSGSRISESHVNNNNTTDHSGSIVVNLYGVMDRDIPQAVVDAISRAQGRRLQDEAMLRGNSRLPG